MHDIATTCCPPATCTVDSTNEVKKRKSFRRTFYSQDNKTLNKNQLGNKTLKSSENTKTNSFEITYADVIHSYDIQNTLQYSWTEEGSYQMNIGIIDLVNPQTWTLPNFPLITEPDGAGVPLSETSYESNFPTATHCRLYKYQDVVDNISYDEFFYEFYQFSEDGIFLLGAIDTIPDLEWVEKNSFNEYLATLPLSINTNLVTNDTIVWKGITYMTDIHIVSEGFGTLVTPAGNVEVLKIRNDYKEKSYDENDVLLNEIEFVAYTFYSKFGHRLNIYLSEGSPTTNVVDIDEVESEIVLFNSNSIPSVQETKKILFYPNPTNGVVKLNEKGDYDIYYINGVVLKSFRNVSEIDISGLAKGTYLVKQLNGQSQKLLIQ